MYYGCFYKYQVYITLFIYFLALSLVVSEIDKLEKCFALNLAPSSAFNHIFNSAPNFSTICSIIKYLKDDLKYILKTVFKIKIFITPIAFFNRL